MSYEVCGLKLLNKIRYLLTMRSSLLIYKVTILPKLEYGHIFYRCAPMKFLNDLQTIQNKCIKTCLYLPKLAHTVDIHKLAGLDLLNVRYRYSLAKLAQTRIELHEYKHVPRANTRSSMGRLLKVPKTKKEASRKSVAYRCAVLWNALPLSVRNSKKCEDTNKLLLNHLRIMNC